MQIPTDRDVTSGNEFDRVEALSDWAASLPHEIEAALRAWGSSNSQVAAVQARVDAAREDRIDELVRSLGVEDAMARLLAQTGVILLIGFQHRARTLITVLMPCEEATTCPHTTSRGRSGSPRPQQTRVRT